MNASTKKAFLISLLLTGVFTLLTVGFCTYALLYDYSAVLGHFSKSVFSDVFLPLLYILAIVVFFVFGFLFHGVLSERKVHVTLPSVFASGFAALTTAAWLVSFAIAFFGESHVSLSTVFGVLLLVFGLLTVVYFIHTALPTAAPSRTTLFGLAAVLFCLVYAFYAYFDPAFALNSPVKIFDQITVIVLLLFFLAEGRMRFGAIRTGVYVPLCMTAVLVSASGSIGGLIYMAVEGRPLFPSVMHDFLLFGFFLYALTRLVSFLLPPVAADKSAEQAESGDSFEADESAPLTSRMTPTFAQESFDFDKADDAAGPTDPENVTEVTFDVDNPEDQ